MSETDNFETENLDNLSEQQEPIGFSDKVTGIFSSPIKTMGIVAKNPPKALDWLIPVIIMVIIASLSAYLYNNNPKLKSELTEKSYEMIDKSLQQQIDKGTITPQEASSQREKIMESMESGGGSRLLLQIVGIAFYSFILFFLVTFIFFLIMRFVLKGDGSYSSAMAAYGISYYILIVQTILLMIITLLTQKVFMGFNLSDLLNLELGTFPDFIIRKLDPFLIWFYIVLGISYAKMFKSENIKKYVIAVLVVWILGNLLLYYISTLSPYLQGITM